MGMKSPNLELAAKFVADKHWRWLPGMRDSDGWVVIDAPPGRGMLCSTATCTIRSDPSDMLPDLEHGGTLGCIEHDLVPAALGDPDACLCFNPHERNWFVYSPKHDDCTTSKPSKADALLAALEEADDIARGAAASAEVPSIIDGAYKRACQHAEDPFVGSVEDFVRLVGQGFDVPGFREDGADVRRACREWSEGKGS